MHGPLFEFARNEPDFAKGAASGINSSRAYRRQAEEFQPSSESGVSVGSESRDKVKPGSCSHGRSR